MRFIVICICISIAIAGCAMQRQPHAWDFYDECDAQTHSFNDMAACGKQKRTAYCQAHNSCSDIGNSIVQYADSLAQSVSSHEMTEPEAKRRFIEFKTSQAQASHQQELQAEAITAASAPTTCSKIGSAVTCY
jgi:hypothetical protein